MKTKSNEEITELMKAMSSEFGFVDKVMNVNRKPHPYMIGVAHVTLASKHGGMLTEEVCREVQCAHPGCTVSYDQHTSDRVAFVKFTRDCTNTEAQDWLKTLVPICEEHKVDGFAFVETGFKVIKEEPKAKPKKVSKKTAKKSKK